MTMSAESARVRGRVARSFRSGLALAFPCKLCHLVAGEAVVILDAPVWGSIAIAREEVSEVVSFDNGPWTISRPALAFRLHDGRYVSWVFSEGRDMVQMLSARGWTITSDAQFRPATATWDHRSADR
jgi:hypothetical protein